jgi:hypothetical protein
MSFAGLRFAPALRSAQNDGTVVIALFYQDDIMN